MLLVPQMQIVHVRDGVESASFLQKVGVFADIAGVYDSLSEILPFEVRVGKTNEYLLQRPLPEIVRKVSHAVRS